MKIDYSCTNSRSREEFKDNGSNDWSNDSWYLLFTIFESLYKILLRQADQSPVWETLCMGLIVKLIWFNTSLNPTVYMVHCKPMFIRCTGLHFLIFYVIVFLKIWSSESFLIWCLFTEEREKPELLAESPARRKRIAQESGKTEQQVCMFATWYGFIFWSNCSFPGK